VSETDLVTTETAPDAASSDAATPPARRRGGLSGMVLAELRQLAGELDIPGTAGMRKGDLIAAIKERQGADPGAGRGRARGTDQLSLSTEGTARSATDSTAPRATDSTAPRATDSTAPRATDGATGSTAPATNGSAPPAEAAPPSRRRRAASRPAGAPASTPAAGSGPGDAAAREPGSAGSEAAGSAAAGAVTTPSGPATTAPGGSGPADSPAGSGPAESGSAESGSGESGSGESGSAAPAPVTDTPAAAGTAAETDGGGRRSRQSRRARAERAEQADIGSATTEPGAASAPAETVGDGERGQRGEGRRSRGDGDPRDGNREGRGRNDRSNDRAQRNDRNLDRANDRANDRDDDGDEDGDGRGRRGRRFRDRRRGRDRDRSGGGSQNVDTEVRDDDVLLPVAGIVDILDNYAFVRTTGYLSGPTDVYVSLSLVRKHGLRRGDAITGAVRQPREGEQSRQKFNPLVRVDTVNGRDPESARSRPEFTKLTPLYPNERLRLETEPSKLTTRVIDLVMPIGKGQRALIVSPPKAGKTMVLQAIANAITTNNPECHLMVVLVDERPEEVTDMQRSVKGEVIASTFDRPPADHTTVAELSIERAKRLVEMGHDVVVLLDSITRLGRAYNLAAPASGRILSGGVDSTALYPPKRFLGAARNIEDGGSLTIFATALVETGSTMDTVIFEEFKGTGNAELKLDRRIADKRVFPAIDVDASGTRKEELLLSPDELAVTVKLRRVLSALDDQQAIDLLLDRLRKSRTNIEFLMQVAKTTPGAED
jgi:transcription termination factor Rho